MLHKNIMDQQLKNCVINEKIILIYTSCWIKKKWSSSGVEAIYREYDDC